MADEKLNTGPAENIFTEAAEPIATPEQAAASESQQEQTEPAIPEPGDVVVSFDKINELIFLLFEKFLKMLNSILSESIFISIYTIFSTPPFYTII